MDILNKHIKLPFVKRSFSAGHLLVHAGYWILVTGFFMYEKKYLIHKASMPYFLACVSVRLVLLIGIAYLNLHYFLPRYLLKKKYFIYLAAVFLSVFAYLILQSCFDYYLYGYVIGPMRNSHLAETLSYNFFSTLWYLALMLALKLSIDWYGQQSQLQKMREAQLNAEIDFLRSQVNPHFLFNALNNLYGLTLKKSDKAPETVLKLSGLMEYMLYESNEEYITLDRELEYLHNYIELERLRSDSNVDIRVNVNGDAEHCLIPPFLLLPLLENAVKHGFREVDNTAFLHVEIDIGPTLSIRVANSQPQTTGKEMKGGIGLKNLRKRLALLYPDRHQLQARELQGAYQVSLKIVL